MTLKGRVLGSFCVCPNERSVDHAICDLPVHRAVPQQSQECGLASLLTFGPQGQLVRERAELPGQLLDERYL